MRRARGCSPFHPTLPRQPWRAFLEDARYVVQRPHRGTSKREPIVLGFSLASVRVLGPVRKGANIAGLPEPVGLPS
jgi:hypothetical protein